MYISTESRSAQRKGRGWDLTGSIKEFYAFGLVFGALTRRPASEYLYPTPSDTKAEGEFSWRP
jgi:hypothetical protein